MAIIGDQFWGAVDGVFLPRNSIYGWRNCFTDALGCCYSVFVVRHTLARNKQYGYLDRG